MPISDAPNLPEGLTHPEPVKHLMSEDLLDACEKAGPGNLVITPVFSDVTCPFCKTMGRDLPRRNRPEREEWESGVNRCKANPDAEGTRRRVVPYLSVHPEREIAEGRGVQMNCPACGVWFTFSPFGLERGAAIAKAMLAAHEHNLERHPRRFLRSLALPAYAREEIAAAMVGKAVQS